MNEMNPIIKKLVNEHFDCACCVDYDQCHFGNGTSDGYCWADGAADGMRIAFEHLAKLPTNEIADTILQAVKGEEK